MSPNNSFKGMPLRGTLNSGISHLSSEATMSIEFRTVALAAMLLATAGCTTLGANSTTGADPSLEGLWGGTVAVSDDPNDLLVLRLSIEGAVARVWVVEDGITVEAKPNAFRISTYKTNAVIHATDSDQDSDGTWVESWALLVTPRGDNELVVAWSRLVNNLDLPLENESSKFAMTGSGLLRRLPSGG